MIVRSSVILWWRATLLLIVLALALLAMAGRRDNYPEWDDLPEHYKSDYRELGVGPREYNSGDPLTSHGLSAPILGRDADTGVLGQWRVYDLSADDATILGNQANGVGGYVKLGRDPSTDHEGRIVEAVDAETGEVRRIRIATDRDLIDYLARVGELDYDFYRIR